jgi:hypothetical protein
MVLLSDCCNGPGYTQPIGAHGDDNLLAMFIKHCQVKRLCVFAAQLKNMPNLNTARDAHSRTTFRASIYLTHIRNVDDSIRSEVPPGY